MSRDRHSYVNFYPDKWLAGVSRLSPLQEWVYLQVCIWNWDKGTPLPESMHKTCFRMHRNCMRDVQVLLELEKLVRTDDGGLYSPKAIDEFDKAFELWEKKSRGGKNSQELQAERDGRTPEKTRPSKDRQTDRQTSIPDGIDARAVKRAKRIAMIDRPPDVTPEVWDDFIELRGRKNAPITETVIKRLRAEAEKAGWAIDDAIGECITRGWQGFRADWVKGNANGRDGKKSGWNFGA